MSTQPQATTAEKGPVSVIAGPWPYYGHFKDLPERDRWVLYGSAKAYREALENQGLVMVEGYDDFVRRVTRELDL
ncbi:MULTISPECIES: hypothetical protein [unclassified Pseudomonas]|uniref:hypothetical protein n=1 Tax=unclassified Pseudomonas TaxID=196821 RepID=UPI000C869593|nr:MULTISPECIES: hypothetical protein [unclassified Pseudomonas]PMV86343.1 hypothetical protein C1X56_15020 [Pseudomonas sp. GW101-1A09]PMV95533.1 hypothetical protein C1X55_21255 [Pseudomonas sp. GW460-C8]PMV97494.1 hypothetical protein C1X51_04510 [Pseudomonas sp. FW306-2-2C-B10A]PMW04845.1 hypothetical protein C1X50_15320 [Pseudomonas sp. MPR-TSA4]PMW13089.1 hypothetical protein C1X52_17890 [Pseudomonas sp. FW306-2-1A-C05A]